MIVKSYPGILVSSIKLANERKEVGYPPNSLIHDNGYVLARH